MSTAQLTPEQQALLPTDEDVQFYREHGYYLSKEIFTDEEIGQALAGSERYYAGEVDEPVPVQLKNWRPKTPPGPGLRKGDYSSFFNRGLARLVRSPLLGEVAARLAGTPSIRLWHDQLLYKPVENPDRKANVGWHTDRGYWKTCTSPAMLTAWIPFHDCDEGMGTITMIDGSHRWPDNTAGLDFFSSDLDGLQAKFNTGGKPVVMVPMNLKKGQVSFHNCLTIHGSGPNHGSSPRRSIAVHLQDESNRYQEYHYADGNLARHDLDSLVRQRDGHPDYTDPEICPTLYPG
ncbi:MAG TPA: phytanoyl-CoA dioxygenase family protein [Acidisoma sp.]|nr:phytanoyl-CoA dioxygenase family protein [Acidisoma sp.]